MDSLTKILVDFSWAANQAIWLLLPYVKGLLVTMAIIDTAYTHLKKLEDGNHIHILIWNIMKYSFWYYVISNYNFIITKLVAGFIQFGLLAGGGKVSYGEFLDPTHILHLGSNYAQPVTDQIKVLTQIGGGFGQQMSLSTLEMGMELSFIIIAIQVFVTYLEFFIIGSVSIVLLPFWANSHTRFMADKVFPVLIGTGVKLMVLAFILSIATPYMVYTPQMGVDINSTDAMKNMAASMALAFLCWQVPAMAAGLMSGMGSGISAASVGQTQYGVGQMARMGAAAGLGAFGAFRQQGVGNDITAATGNALTPPPNSDGSSIPGRSGSPFGGG